MLADLVPQLIVMTFQPTTGEKLCGKCDEWKPHEAFSADNRHAGGLKLQRWCKVCLNKANKDWYKRNR